MAGRRKKKFSRRVLDRLSSVRLRAVLAVAGVFAVLGVGATGTWAYWTDSATVEGGTFQAGTLDIKVNGEDGKPDAYSWDAFNLTDMVPGESVARAISVQNAGTVDLTYSATATGSGNAGLLADLTFTTYAGGAATNSVTSSGLRTGSCSGTTSGPKTLTSAAAAVIPGPRPLTVATGAEGVCVVAALATAAASTDQGKSASATFVFTAKQVGAP